MRAVLEALTERLAGAGVPTPAVDAELLVRHVTGWSRGRLQCASDDTIPPGLASELSRLADRRAAREPLQLIVGSVGFRYVDVAVRPGVFIPRPETEVLAGLALERLSDAGGTVLEPCTGTGAIACALAGEAPGATVLATDIDDDAVALARLNAARNDVAVTVLQGDLLAPVPARLAGHVDVLVSNPPYLAAADLEGLEPEVVAWDPHRALVSGPRGDEVPLRLVRAAPRWLRPGGWLLLEVDPSRAAAAAMSTAGWADAAVAPDLAGRDRFVVARRR